MEFSAPSPAREVQQGPRPRPLARSSSGGCRPCRRGLDRSKNSPTSAARRRDSFSKAARSTKTAICGSWRSAAAGSIPDARWRAGPGGQLQPAARAGPDLRAAGSRWLDGKLYLTSRHRGILVYDPQTKELKTLVYTWRNQLFKGPNDLDFDAEGNLFFTDPWATGPGPNMSDRAGAIYQYSRDGILRKVMDGGLFPNGIAVYPDDTGIAIGDCAAGRMWYASFANGPNMGCPQCPKDPLHLTFAGVKAGTYVPGNGGPDGIHYDVNLWAQLFRLGGIAEIDPRGIILGFVPLPNGDITSTNFAFGGPDNQYIYFEGATSGTFWRFKAPYPGLIGPGGVRLPAQ